MSSIITLSRIDDMHCHFRVGEMLTKVLPHTAKYAGRAIAMPNTRPRAILTKDDVIWYRKEILRVLDSQPIKHSFNPLMTIEIRDDTTPKMVEAAFRAGAVAGKVYPIGVTTNSDEGLRDFYHPKIQETFRAMEELGMLLLLHGEFDRERVLVTEREKVFLPTLVDLAEKFPRLKIVLEHVSSEAGVNQVLQLGDNVAATITAHHLCLTLNDVIGHGIRPHHACMPTAKGFADRNALILAAISGTKFFLGSDSAPHPRKKKECAVGACGVYTAPVLLPVLVEVFIKAGHLDRLEAFTSGIGARFYGLPLNEELVTLERKSWTVPEEIDGIVPFRAGTTLEWQVV